MGRAPELDWEGDRRRGRARYRALGTGGGAGAPGQWEALGAEGSLSLRVGEGGPAGA